MKPLDIPLSQIRVMLSRAREKEGWDQLKASMGDVGLLVPVQVRDLGKVDADGCRYELICGEGRVEAARALAWATIPALVVEAESAEVAGRFLAENMMRKSLPWATKGRMVRDELASGGTLAQAAARLHITEGLAAKYLRTVNKVAHDERALSLSVNTAEVLATIPKGGQSIVMDLAAEMKVPVKELAKASKRAVAEGAGWTKASLQKALAAKDDELSRMRQRVKLLRLHRSLGPGNLERLHASAKFRSAAKGKVNFAAFQ